MTLSATYEPRRQQGNGVTKEFSYSFDPYSLEALKVYIEENGVQTETQDYTATADENGGIVTFNVAPTSEQYVVITRSVPQDQEVPFYTSSGFDAGVVENCFDKLTAMVQEVSNETVRSAKLPKGYNINLELPVPESGKGLYWNNEGTGFQNSRLNLDDVETLTKSYRDQSLAARDEAVASSTRAVNTVKEATDLLANTQTYVEEAVETINTAVEDAKTTITETSEEAKETINGYVSNAEENVRQIAQEEANKAIEGAAAQATAIVVDYTNNEIKPELMAFVTSADEDSMMASEYAEKSRKWAEGSDTEVIALGGEHSSKTWSGMAKQYATSAQGYASSSESSARIAQTAASQASQASGKIIQIGFDGALEKGKLVFKHAPSGVEIPYSLLDDYEYEVDMFYDSLRELPSDLPMVIKNGADTVTFVSSLHRSADEPVTVGNMAPVMRKDNIGYRWLFKAAYKITPAGKHVLLLYPVAATSTTITYWE